MPLRYYSNRIKDRTGIRYGRLIVKEFVRQDWNGYHWFTLWKCQCDCGKEIIVRGNNLQKRYTKSCGCLRREIMNSQIGKKNNNYTDGEYTKVLKLKEKIRKRDNYICQECNKTQEQNLKETNEILSVHHIDGDDTNNVEENMTSLCKSCHSKINNEELSE